MTLQQAKAKASQLYDNGQWLQLAILILQFGKELITYLRERLKEKRNDKTKNDTDRATQDAQQSTP